MIKYKENLNPYTNTVDSITIIDEFKWVPADENNPEYQAFLENIDEYELVKESE